jgi:hypothetical protein
MIELCKMVIKYEQKGVLKMGEHWKYRLKAPWGSHVVVTLVSLCSRNNPTV